MENFKIDIFKSENINKSFPDFQKQSPETCAIFKNLVSKKIGLIETDSLLILKHLRDKSQPLLDINAETADFDFIKLINKFELYKPKHVNINWYHFDDIDQFKLVDFNTNFEYIWYPGPDEIEIFPDDISWIISIDATGSIYLFCS